MSDNKMLATFGAGCFWCVEAVFQQVKGVENVVSGYMGGKISNPTYREVCSGLTGHAEVIQMTYDPKVVSFEELLEIFWKTHDPTTPNRQGADAGTQYRSVVFYHSDEQKESAERVKELLDEASIWSNPIVTEISPATEMYDAEEHHQNYYQSNGSAPYCQAVIVPKLEKFKRLFSDKIKA